MTSRFDRYGDYIVDRRESLGSGTYGTVWRGYRILQEREGAEDYLEAVAIKESAYDLKNIQEISTLQILSHPNIIRYIDYKISKDSLYLVMQLCEGGTLEDLLHGLDDLEDRTPQIIQYYSQIVSGIRFMYEKNILHRDLKPSNILIKDNKVKIADFGTSKLKNQNEMIRTLVGTPLFASPQILQLSIGEQQSYTEKSDIWSLGLILYFMFHYQKHIDSPMKRVWESLPWKGKNALDVLHSIKTQPLEFRCPTMPEEIKNIVRKMLTVDVEKRMSFQEFFTIELFQKEGISRVRQAQSLQMSQSVVNLEFSGTFDDREYELTLLNECTKQPQFIKRQTIDFELLKLLQIKNSEEHEEREIWDALKFYQILREEAQESNEDLQYNDLIFEIDCQVYQLLLFKRYLLRKFSCAHKAIRKSTNIQLQSDILTMLDNQEVPKDEIERQFFHKAQIIAERYCVFAKRFESINAQTRDLLGELMNTSNIVEKEKLLMGVIVPNEHLSIEMKIVLKKLKPTVKEAKQKLNAVMAKEEVYLIYDLLTAMAFDYSWKSRRQHQAKNSYKTDYFEAYKQQRKKIRIAQLIDRILKAFESIKLS